MKPLLIITAFFFFLLSCKKRTDCSGHVFSLNGNPAKNIEIYLVENINDYKRVAITNDDGYYIFNFEAKLRHNYKVTCENHVGDAPSVIRGKANNNNLYIRK
jgi:hypothetical protein